MEETLVKVASCRRFTPISIASANRCGMDTVASGITVPAKTAVPVSSAIPPPAAKIPSVPVPRDGKGDIVKVSSVFYNLSDG